MVIQAPQISENAEYSYHKAASDGYSITVRVRKSDNDIKVCLDEMVLTGINNITVEEFMEVNYVHMFYKQSDIEKDNYDNRYYASREIVTKLFERLQKFGRGSGIDWNVRSPNTLTIRGFLNALDGAVLGGFLVDNDKFVSLAETNQPPNIRLNGDDGSGHLAAGNVAWDALGNLLIRGWFESNNSGNRIVIDPVQ